MSVERLGEEIERMGRKLDMIVEAVVGNPADETRPGMIIRLDRLERANRSLRFGGGLLATGLITMIAAYLLRFV